MDEELEPTIKCGAGEEVANDNVGKIWESLRYATVYSLLSRSRWIGSKKWNGQEEWPCRSLTLYSLNPSRMRSTLYVNSLSTPGFLRARQRESPETILTA